MKNIHILPTPSPSRLSYDFDINQYYLQKETSFWEHQNMIENRNIYITNDEEIKEGDWILLPNNEIIILPTGLVQIPLNNFIRGYSLSDCKKIILTTDQDLIKDGVQPIDDEFLEWFVKNPSCEVVEIAKTNKLIDNYADKDEDKWDVKYHIYLPTEESKQECMITKIMQMDAKMAYDSLPKHKVEAIPAEEILANRSNAYEFIDFDKNAKTYLVNPRIAPFLLKNGFKGSGGDSYCNSKCTVTVLDGYYKIDWNHIEYGEVSTYTDSYSITHLVGVLTWNDLIDKNYKK